MRPSRWKLFLLRWGSGVSCSLWSMGEKGYSTQYDTSSPNSFSQFHLVSLSFQPHLVYWYVTVVLQHHVYCIAIVFFFGRFKLCLHSMRP